MRPFGGERRRERRICMKQKKFSRWVSFAAVLLMMAAVPLAALAAGEPVLRFSAPETSAAVVGNRL